MTVASYLTSVFDGDWVVH